MSAWRTIAPKRSRVARVDRLRAKEQRDIYRLMFDNGLPNVIAKRAVGKALALERTIYENVLPQLPIAGLRYFGFVGEEGDDSAWLFIEDAGDDRCVLAEHGHLAARWLGTLHGAAADLDLMRSLPEHDADRYLEHLHASCKTILSNFDNPALRADDKGVLRAVISTCKLIESRWDVVESICRDLPRTLVHGDLVARNLRLRPGEAGPAIVAFDWECTGFGVPAADVYMLALAATPEDLTCYRDTVSEYMGGVRDEELQALLRMGNGFRLLASVDWVTPHLRHAWPERATATLRCYEGPLREWGEELAVTA